MVCEEAEGNVYDRPENKDPPRQQMQTDKKVNLCMEEAIFGRVSALSNSD